MATGVIGLCGQCVISLVMMEKDQELGCVTTPHQNLAEKNAMKSHWRQRHVVKLTAKVQYHCSKYLRSISKDQNVCMYV